MDYIVSTVFKQLKYFNFYFGFVYVENCTCVLFLACGQIRNLQHLTAHKGKFLHLCFRTNTGIADRLAKQTHKITFFSILQASTNGLQMKQQQMCERKWICGVTFSRGLHYFCPISQLLEMPLTALRHAQWIQSLYLFRPLFKIILFLFSNDAMDWSKMTVKAFLF